tara:strand:+ start:194 stop:553 length:360 start_codon:yes stop_codon:yes gene_type:complete
MLLRASSKANEKSVSLSCAIGEPLVSDIDEAELLIEFTEFANEYPPKVKELSAQIISRMGEESFIKASSIVAIFNGLVRSADAMGIPLDDVTISSTTEERIELGINKYKGFNNLPECEN